MIELQNISKTFNKEKATETLALNNVSLKILNNQYVVIVGSNGSGKSTLLHIAGLLDSPDAGSVYIENIPAHKLCNLKYASHLF